LKRIASIALLCLLVFNWYGYRFVLQCLEVKADRLLEQKLNTHAYATTELIEITVPLTLPYQTDWAEFERIDGAIEINGIHYKYVERKIVNGQLVLKCIPHHTQQLLVNARDAFFKLVNDLQQPSNKKSPNKNIVKNIVLDYTHPKQLCFNTTSPYCLLQQQWFTTYQFFIPTTWVTAPARPPDCMG
jgi:hypothetical protein